MLPYRCRRLLLPYLTIIPSVGWTFMGPLCQPPKENKQICYCRLNKRSHGCPSNFWLHWPYSIRRHCRKVQDCQDTYKHAAGAAPTESPITEVQHYTLHSVSGIVRTLPYRSRRLLLQLHLLAAVAVSQTRRCRKVQDMCKHAAGVTNY